MKRIAIVLVLFLIVPAVVFSWEFIQVGPIGSFQVTDGENYDFRVVVGSGHFFLNESDSNYKVYVAMLMYADAMNYTVTIYSDSVDPPYDLYHIDFLVVAAP